jgi:LysM repeat protein
MRLRNGRVAYMLVFVMLFIFSSTAVSAGVTKHSVRPGESLAVIAKNFYGDPALFEIVALYNGIRDPSKLGVGSRISLPYSDAVVIKRGQSLSLISSKYLSDPLLYPVLAEINGLSDPTNVPAGTMIRIPVMISYRLQKGESISTVADRFYGDPRSYSVIALSSGISDAGRVKSGTRLKVPMVLVKRSQSPRSEVAKPPKKKAPAGGLNHAEKLAGAEKSYRVGDYERARELLKIALPGLKGSEKARALRIEADISYAYGNTEGTLTALAVSYRFAPDFTPQPAMYNPEMIKLYQKAKSRAGSK